MGLYASYYAIKDNKTYEYDNSIQLDKFWDGLHFLLTGFNRDECYNVYKNEEQLALYYAFFGQKEVSDEMFYLEDVNIVANIAKILNTISIDDLLENVDFNKFIEKDIYSDFWCNECKDELCRELKSHFENLKTFYQNALKNNHSVLITIC